MNELAELVATKLAATWEATVGRRRRKARRTSGELMPGTPLPLRGAIAIPVWSRRGVVAFAFVDETDAQLANYRWHLTSYGYAARKEKQGDRWVMVRMHRSVVDAAPNAWVDHINRNRLDNRRSNLRLVDAYQNAWNCGRHGRNTSGYRGVLQECDIGWIAKTHHRKASYHLGTFATPEDAARAYDYAAVVLRGDFAVLNFTYTIEQIADMKNWHAQFTVAQ